MPYSTGLVISVFTGRMFPYEQGIAKIVLMIVNKHTFMVYYIN